jgi:hypothetical protein
LLRQTNAACTGWHGARLHCNSQLAMRLLPSVKRSMPRPFFADSFPASLARSHAGNSGLSRAHALAIIEDEPRRALEH